MASPALKFLLAAAIVYETLEAICSSPQTVEINARSRSETLFSWVHLGFIQGGALAWLAAQTDSKSNLWLYLLGGISAGLILDWSYLHAKASGLRSAEPGTETTEPEGAVDHGLYNGLWG